VSELCVASHEDRRLATVGKLCEAHARNLARDCLAAADVYRALLVPPVAGATQRVSGSTERPIPYADARGDARETIRCVMQGWAALIRDETGASITSVLVAGLAPFVAAHWRWLAGHDLAGYAAMELHELAWGAPWRAAYPSGGTRQIERLGYCPHETDAGLCGGDAKARLTMRGEGDVRASVITCEAGHTYEARQWLPAFAEGMEGTLAVDEASLALYGDATFGDSVRSLISRGRLARGDDGRVTFDSVLALHAEWHGAGVSA
jgi:hypothetical protein